MKKTTLLGRVLLASLLACTQSLHAQDYKWANGFGGSGDDRAYASTTDADGNVYVTGIFTGTADFDPGAGLATLTSLSDADAFIAKYSSSGAYIWAERLGQAGTAGSGGSAIAIDPSGDVVVSGYFSGTVDFDFASGGASRTSLGMNDIFLLKLDKDGGFKWVNTIGGPYTDYATTVTIDNNGNILMGGGFADFADFDPSLAGMLLDASKGGLFMARYDKDGKYKWARNIGCNGGSQFLNALTTDKAGNIYVTGSFNGPADFDPGTGSVMLPSIGYQDLFVARYDTSGNYVWANHTGSSKNVAQSYGITVSSTGNVTIAGIYYETVDFDPGSGVHNLTATFPSTPNIFMAQYDAGGNYKWANSMGTSISGGGSIKASGLAIDKEDNLYMSGYFSKTVDFDPTTGIASLTSKMVDMYFAKYTGAGEYVWAHKLAQKNSVIAGMLPEVRVSVDGKGSIYLAGSFGDTTNFDPAGSAAPISALAKQDAVVAKYNDVVTGIPETAVSNPFFALYPNPADKQISLQAKSAFSAAAELRIFNALGQQVALLPLSQAGTNNTYILNLEPYALLPGTYCLQVADGGQQTTQRFVIR